MKRNEDIEKELEPGDVESAADQDITSQEVGEESETEHTAEVESLSLEQAVELKAALEEVQGKADEYLDGWQRSRAEFANYKKRIMREYDDIQLTARGEIIKIYLDLADDLERALREKPSSDEGQAWAEGIDIIYQKLIKRLETEGITPMDALGKEFDPTIHEALMKEESDKYQSGEIIEVVQKGYWMGDKVLRPALVRVAA
jgi:molecular chaperone GrpE